MSCSRVAFLIGSLLFTGLCNAQEHASAAKPDPALDAYAKPGTLVDVGAGRNINLRCAGSGTPVVMLESGNVADSMAWLKVQPEIAKFTRACAYDRAGIGYSDGGPLPRNLDANADDLFALIHAAKIATPVVLVGHSYGTNVVRRAAEKHAQDVAALILIDPPPQNIGEFSAEFDKAEAEETAAGLAAYRKCAEGAEKKQLDAGLPELKPCLRGPNPAYSDTLNAALHARKILPAFWQMIISITESNAEMYKQAVSPKESHAATPLLILQPDTPFADAPPEIQKPMEQARQKTHKAIAATSSRSRIIAVAKSSHDVQFDQPAAVVSAVREAIEQAKSKSANAKHATGG